VRWAALLDDAVLLQRVGRDERLTQTVVTAGGAEASGAEVALLGATEGTEPTELTLSVHAASALLGIGKQSLPQRRRNTYFMFGLKNRTKPYDGSEQVAGIVGLRTSRRLRAKQSCRSETA
jgi:hypothetical protein